MYYDLVIVGSGFGGAILAQVARQQGRSVLLVERGEHPRFAIGESTSPLMNLLIEELAQHYDLPALLPLSTYGTWKAAYPQLGVGLKRGFTYYAHQPHQPFGRCQDHRDQLAVAASPGDPCADTHWLRADVDHFLVNEAIQLGADYTDRTTVVDFVPQESLTLARAGRQWRVRAGFVVDASGPNGFLHRHFGQRDIGYDGYPATRSLFTHFVGVKRTETLPAFATGRPLPFDRDAAALHHVFPGGWMWVLPFDNGVTSAGIAVEAWLADELDLATNDDAAWARFLARFPSIREQFADATPVAPWVYLPQLSFRTERVVGPGWALLPSAAGFIDPLFSTGMPLTLLGIQRLAALLDQDALTDTARLAEYEAITFAELDQVAALVGTIYPSFAQFEHFAALTMYYFAAASYAEVVRRLHQHDSTFRYLAANDPVFRAGIARCRESLGLPAPVFAERIAADIAHRNIAGLADPTKGNAYGVDLGDLVRGAAKLGRTPQELEAILATAPWAQCG